MMTYCILFKEQLIDMYQAEAPSRQKCEARPALNTWWLSYVRMKNILWLWELFVSIPVF